MFLGKFIQGKGTLFRNIQNTGWWHYSALGSRRGYYVLVGFNLLIRLPSYIYFHLFLQYTPQERNVLVFTV